MQINGPSGYTADTTSRKELKTFSVQRTEAADLALQGRLFVFCPGSLTPAGANNVFLHIGNTGSTPLHVFNINIMPANGEQYLIYRGANTTLTGGTATTPARSLSSDTVAPTVATNYGTNITAYDSNGVLIGQVGINGGKNMGQWPSVEGARIIVPPGQAMWIAAVAGSIAAYSSVMFGLPNTDKVS